MPGKREKKNKKNKMQRLLEPGFRLGIASDGI